MKYCITEVEEIFTDVSFLIFVIASFKAIDLGNISLLKVPK